MHANEVLKKFFVLPQNVETITKWFLPFVGLSLRITI